MSTNEYVVLVNEDDQEIGTMEKMEAHLTGKLHRAFSVFVFNTKGELLLQQRALHKYHSGGKWTNTCCSHPRPGEDIFVAANRRLKEEMNMYCVLQYAFSFTYYAALQQGIIENEYDHVFFGITDQLPLPNFLEAEGFQYMDLFDLEEDIKNNPDHYTEWLKICFDRVKNTYFKTQINYSSMN